jgi:hypothetical protein
VDILNAEQLSERVNFARPLKSEPEDTESLWNIPFEYGNCPKGTRISLSKAREIAATLRALIAEAETRQLRREYDSLKARAEESGRQYTAAAENYLAALGVIADLKRRLRTRGKAR